MIKVHSTPENSDLYDLLWDYQESKADIKSFSLNRKSVVEELIPSDLIKGKHILDLCCGRGRLSAGCLDHGVSKVTCVDGSHTALEATQRNLASLGYEAELIQANVDLLGDVFESETFDVSLMLYALQHIKDYKQVLSDLYKITKTNGIIAFNFFETGTTPKITRDLRNVFLKYDVRFVFEFLTDVGYLDLPSNSPFDLADIIDGKEPEKYKDLCAELEKIIKYYGIDLVKSRLHLEDFGTPYVHNFNTEEVLSYVKELGLTILHSTNNKIIARK